MEGSGIGGDPITLEQNPSSRRTVGAGTLHTDVLVLGSSFTAVQATVALSQKLKTLLVSSHDYAEIDELAGMCVTTPAEWQVVLPLTALLSRALFRVGKIDMEDAHTLSVRDAGSEKRQIIEFRTMIVAGHESLRFSMPPFTEAPALNFKERRAAFRRVREQIRASSQITVLGHSPAAISAALEIAAHYPEKALMVGSTPSGHSPCGAAPAGTAWLEAVARMRYPTDLGKFTRQKPVTADSELIIRADWDEGSTILDFPGDSLSRGNMSCRREVDSFGRLRTLPHVFVLPDSISTVPGNSGNRRSRALNRFLRNALIAAYSTGHYPLELKPLPVPRIPPALYLTAPTRRALYDRFSNLVPWRHYRSAERRLKRYAYSSRRLQPSVLRKK